MSGMTQLTLVTDDRKVNLADRIHGARTPPGRKQAAWHAGRTCEREAAG